MRRSASVLALAVLALGAADVRAEPLDLELARLGAPDPGVWAALAGRVDPSAEDVAYARYAKERFGVLSSEVALALSGPILQPASTTGHAGFDVAFEGSYARVHSAPVGLVPAPGVYANSPAAGYSASPWATRGELPGSLTTTGVHVRKALPFSLEVGGRLTYLNKSSYFAAQGEAKWALNEGFEHLPDIGVRFAYTRLFGQADWNLGATDLDFMVSKRWGVSGVTSFTPYLAARFTFVSASSEMMDFAGLADDAGTFDRYAGMAAFPDLRVGLYRTTAGVRMTASVVSLALEATYFGGKSYSGEDAPSRDDYGDFRVPSAFSGAAKLGWEF